MNNKGRINIFFVLMLIIFFIVLFFGYVFYTNENGKEKIANIYISNFDIENVDVKPNNIEERENLKINFTNTSNSNNVNIIQEQVNSKSFYFNQLDENGKIIYNKISENKENIKTGTYCINFETIFNDLLHKENGEQTISDSFQAGVTAYILDNVDCFYIDVSKLKLKIISTTIGTNTTYTVTLENDENGTYFIDGINSRQDVEIKTNQLENVRKLVVDAAKNMDDYEKIKMVHDTLVDNLTYDLTTEKINTHNVYGALVERNSVCDGYAKAMKYLLDTLDVPCIIVTGVGKNSEEQTESHAWNYVKLNGQWYGIDATWDDPIINGENASLTPEEYKYQFFLKGKETFETNYVKSEYISNTQIKIYYPELNDKDYK